jgi:hypothetical protein
MAATRTKSATVRRPKATGPAAVQINPQDILIPESAPDILIDGISGVAVINGIVRLNCVSIRPIGPVEQRPTLVARLLLSPETFKSIHSALSQVLEEFEKSGVVSKS